MVSLSLLEEQPHLGWWLLWLPRIPTVSLPSILPCLAFYARCQWYCLLIEMAGWLESSWHLKSWQQNFSGTLPQFYTQQPREGVWVVELVYEPSAYSWSHALGQHRLLQAERDPAIHTLACVTLDIIKQVYWLYPSKINVLSRKKSSPTLYKGST